MSITIRSSDLWWNPFLRKFSQTSVFSKYCIGSPDAYKKLVRQHVNKRNGKFFYACDEVGEVIAASAVSLSNGLLVVHFYCRVGGSDGTTVVKSMFRKVIEMYEDNELLSIHFGRPRDEGWDKSFPSHPDQNRREICWYIIPYHNFRLMAGLNRVSDGSRSTEPVQDVDQMTA